MGEQGNPGKFFLQIFVCSGILVLGITLTLSWWVDVVVLFKGAIGIMLALLGILGLFLLRK